MAWTENELKMRLQTWDIDLNMIEDLCNCYIGKGDSFKEGVCLTISALQDCYTKGAIIKRFIVPRLLKLMNLWSELTHTYFFEVLSATAFTSEQRVYICESMASIAELTENESNYKKVFVNMTGCGSDNLFVGDETSQKACMVMTNRINNLNNFLLSVRQYEAYQQCKEIQLTGSDSHMGNKQVLLITKSNDEKIVYKPHSVWAEELVTKTINLFNQFFDTHPQLGFQDLDLPVLEAKTIKTPGGVYYGEVGFVEKVQRMSCDNAKKYYKKMGVLAFIAKMLGLTDLHEENIMATINGPIVLDAECILNPKILGDCNFSHTCLDMALGRGSGEDGGCAEAAFFIGEGPTAPKSNTEFWKYRDEFFTGFFSGEMAFREIYASFIDLIRKWHSDNPEEPKRMRWVPFSTHALKVYLGMYADNNDLWKGEAEKNSYKELCNLSKSDADNVWDSIWDKLKTAMEKSFWNGDIPYFSIYVTEDSVKVFCDETEIWNFNTLSKEKLIQIINENGRQTLSGGWNQYKEGFSEIFKSSRSKAQEAEEG